VDTTSDKPRYSIDGQWRAADFLVLAAGARNQFLPGTRALQRDELEMTQGYFVPQTSEEIIIKFLPDFEATSGPSPAPTTSRSAFAAA